MAIVSFVAHGTEYSLLLLVVSGLSILPAAWCQYCNTVNTEPKIKISSTPSSNNLAIGASINLTCTAWQTNELANNPKTRPHIIEWFDPQDKRVGDKCYAGRPPASLMNCTLMVGALTDEKHGNYTCRARNGYNYCSTKRFEIKLRAPKVTVHCESQYMTVIVAKALLPGVDRGHLQLRNSSCSATETTTHFSLTTPLDGCLTSFSETPTSLLYSNKVLEIPSDMIMNEAVTRKKQVEIPFSCQYSKSGMVSSSGWKPEINVVELVNVEGRGNLTMTLNMFPDSNFATPYYQKDMPVAVKIQQPLFFEVLVLTSDSQLTIGVHRCYATPTQHHNGSIEYNFIQNGCPADESTHFIPATSESAQRFTTTAFQFTGDHPFVFVHCHVVICDRNDSLSECRKTCPSSDGRLRKREVHDHLIDGYSLGQGPVHLIRRKRDLDRTESCACNKNGSGLAIDILVVLALVCVVSLTATVLMFLRKFRHVQHGDSRPITIP